MNPYKTLMKAGVDEVVINKSRFIGHAAPVKTPEEALEFLEKIRTEYRDASHHCYAYVIGKNAGIMRYSDDGEPGGTAGLPMMEVLKARSVVDCAVVVTRYFGGILLGAGGLVRAYRRCCTLALNAAGVCTMHPTQRYFCEIPYSLWDRALYTFKSLPIQMENTEFTASVSFEMLVRTSDSEDVLQQLTRVTDGRSEFLLEEELYSPWIETATPEEDTQE